jgi:predicted kinase
MTEHDASGPRVGADRGTLFLMVGLPAAGKTTLARELAGSRQALRLTPDEWHLPLFGESLTANGKRDVLEGRLITVALRTVRLGTSVVLDFGLWSRDERSALRRLAHDAGAPVQVVYLPVEPTVQHARIVDRWTRTPRETFPMPEADVVVWRERFEPPDADELSGGPIPDPPPGWSTWSDWAADRWPTLDPCPG